MHSYELEKALLRYVSSPGSADECDAPAQKFVRHHRRPKVCQTVAGGGRGLTKLRMLGLQEPKPGRPGVSSRCLVVQPLESGVLGAVSGTWRLPSTSLLVSWDQRREDQVGGAAHRLGREHPTTGRGRGRTGISCSEPAEPRSGKDNLPIASEAEAWPRRERHLRREENTRLGRHIPCYLCQCTCDDLTDSC